MPSVMERRSFVESLSDEAGAKAQSERVPIALLAMQTFTLRLQHGASA
jgi:hypothetical protein